MKWSWCESTLMLASSMKGTVHDVLQGKNTWKHGMHPDECVQPYPLSLTEERLKLPQISLRLLGTVPLGCMGQLLAFCLALCRMQRCLQALNFCPANGASQISTS